MKCPHCGLIVTDRVPRCAGCGFSIADLDQRLGGPPLRRGCLNDYAGLLQPAEREALEARLAEVNAALGGEVVLVTRADTRPVKPAEYVFWLFNRWGIGGLEHAGILLLVALAERRVESEVGYAWEDAVSDVESAEVLEEHVVPLLREGRWAEALRAAVDRLAEVLQASRAKAGQAPREEARDDA